MASSRSFKWTIGGVATIVGIFIALQPYFSVKDRQEHSSEEMKVMKKEAREDHDLLIKVSTEMVGIKENVSEIKEDVGDIKADVSDIKRYISNQQQRAIK